MICNTRKKRKLKYLLMKRNILRTDGFTRLGDQVKDYKYQKLLAITQNIAILSHDKWITIIILEGKTCASYYTFQWIICNVYG